LKQWHVYNHGYTIVGAPIAIELSGNLPGEASIITDYYIVPAKSGSSLIARRLMHESFPFSLTGGPMSPLGGSFHCASRGRPGMETRLQPATYHNSRDAIINGSSVSLLSSDRSINRISTLLPL